MKPLLPSQKVSIYVLLFLALAAWFVQECALGFLARWRDVAVTLWHTHEGMLP